MFYNASDMTETRTVNISACAVSGQPTVKYAADWSGIAITTITAGITSDRATFGPGMLIAYLCSNNEAAEYSPASA